VNEAKGEAARRILADETFKEAVQGARKRIKDQWEAAESKDVRESLWHQLRALDAVPQELRILQDRGYKEKHDREKNQ
jgi:hypothetical protein